MIGRRDVLALATAATAISLNARAQQLPRIAVVDQGEPVESIAEGKSPQWSPFLRELRALGHVEGETIIIERWTAAGADDAGLASLAQAVVASHPTLIVTRGSRAVVALGDATATIAIVARAGLEPLVVSLARPGGNITGINEIAGVEIIIKRVQLLHEAVPAVAHIAWLGPRAFWERPGQQTARLGAEQFGLTLDPVFIESPTSETTIRSAFAAIAGAGFDALHLSASPDMTPYRRLIAELALAAGLPSTGFQRDYADAGVMLAYGPDQRVVARRLAGYVDRILAGADPAEMPVEQPTTFDFVVNLRTAEALGITLPPSIMLMATEVIE